MRQVNHLGATVIPADDGSWCQHNLARLNKLWLSGIVQCTPIHCRTIFALALRYTYQYCAFARATVPIIRSEGDVIDATIPVASAFGADLGCWCSNSIVAIRAGIATTRSFNRFVLVDAVHRDDHCIAVGVGHAQDIDWYSPMVRWPERSNARFGARAHRRLILVQHDIVYVCGKARISSNNFDPNCNYWIRNCGSERS
jgi:hypothetical protein